MHAELGTNFGSHEIHTKEDAVKVKVLLDTVQVVPP